MALALDGVLNVLKPSGTTSHMVVAKLRKLTGERKVGHAGTLDPEACGVLPLCFGKATRIVEYLSSLDKAYRAEVTFGISTDTQDWTGQAVSVRPAPKLTQRDLEAVIPQFLGEIEQEIPMLSAVHYRGQKLYKLAQKGISIENRPVRRTRIDSIELVDFKAGSFPRALVDVVCSKGTYIRTLCVDVGKALGLPSHLSYLLRTRFGKFEICNSYTLEEISRSWESGNLESIMLSVDQALDYLPVVEVPVDVARLLSHGTQPAPHMIKLPPEVDPGEVVRVRQVGGQLVGLGQVVARSPIGATRTIRMVKVLSTGG